MFRLTPAGRPARPLSDRLLAAAEKLTTPLLPEDYLSLVDPLWSTTELRGRVEHVRRETPDAVTLVVRPSRGWPGHTAGQYVRLGVDIDGVRHWRSYSLTSAEGDECIAVTVNAVDGGRVSTHLVRDIGVGAVVHLEPPAGDFVLPTPLRPLLFVTAGSGITPAMGMLRTLAAAGGLPDVVVLHSARTPEAVVFGEDLQALAATHPSLRLHLRHTATDGRLDLGALDELCPDWRERAAYVCGPAALLDAAERRWAEAGIGDRLRVERFAPVLAAVGGTGGDVTFTATGTTTTADGSTSLLDAGEAAGVLMPSGCRMGVCHTCVVPLRAGRVRDLRTGEVTGDEGDLVQTCISAAAGPVSLAV